METNLMVGQINLNDTAGQIIFQTCQKNDVETIVEIGTWNGCGSTNCIYEAIKGTNKTCLSLEINEKMHELAKQNLIYKKEIKLIRGKITDKLIEISKENKQFFTDYSYEQKLNWLNSDKKDLLEVSNAMDQMPSKIDFLILDGGEFSSWFEYEILKNRSKYIFLDDTKPPAFKNYQSRIDMIQNHITIIDNQNERNGYYLGQIK
jgi:hypothetical protein